VIKNRERGRVVGRKRSLVVATLLVVVAAGCGWAYPGFDARSTRYNGFERTLSASNVAGITERWRAPSRGGVLLSVGGRVYTAVDTVGLDFGRDMALVAYDAAGVAGCSGTPKTCTPLLTFGSAGCQNCVLNGFAVADDTVFRWMGDPSQHDDAGSVAAFDARGASGCDPVTHTCQPIRTYLTGFGGSSGAHPPVVVDGVLYAISYDTSLGVAVLSAFDAHGFQSCTGIPVVCAPLWRGLLPTVAASGAAPVVANGTVYVSTLHGFAAFDATGQTHCGSTRLDCLPTFVSSGTAYADSSDPAVANGFVYLAHDGQLFAYDARGIAGCTSGVCSPAWSSPTPPPGSSSAGGPVVAGGRVYLPRTTGLTPFDAKGKTGCHDVPVVCDPIGSGFSTIRATAANDLVAGISFSGSPARVFSAATGAALWSENDPTLVIPLSDVEITDGTVMVSLRSNESTVGTLIVYGLNPA
jgi:hypothetical protein